MIKLIIHEVFTAPIKLSLKLCQLKVLVAQANNKAPQTPIVAASVGVA